MAMGNRCQYPAPNLRVTSQPDYCECRDGIQPSIRYFERFKAKELETISPSVMASWDPGDTLMSPARTKYNQEVPAKQASVDTTVA